MENNDTIKLLKEEVETIAKAVSLFTALGFFNSEDEETKEKILKLSLVIDKDEIKQACILFSAIAIKILNIISTIEGEGKS